MLHEEEFGKDKREDENALRDYRFPLRESADRAKLKKAQMYLEVSYSLSQPCSVAQGIASVIDYLDLLGSRCTWIST